MIFRMNKEEHKSSSYALSEKHISRNDVFLNYIKDHYGLYTPHLLVYSFVLSMVLFTVFILVLSGASILLAA